jgi:hypothetical protein
MIQYSYVSIHVYYEKYFFMPTKFTGIYAPYIVRVSICDDVLNLLGVIQSLLLQSLLKLFFCNVPVR